MAIQLRRDTAANWASNNPTPVAGQPCFETDTKKMKVGDGSTAYNSLAYITAGAVGALLAANNLSDLANAGTSRTNLGLGNVDNTSDLAKPVSTAQQTALDLKANLASPTFTGVVTVPTPTGGDNSTKAASTAFVLSELASAVSGLLSFKGVTDCSANPNYPAATKGDSYIVSVAGKIGGASGISVDIGDWFIATANNAGGTEASVGSSWAHLEHNLVGALLASNNLSDLANITTAVANLGLTIGTNVQAHSTALDALTPFMGTALSSADEGHLRTNLGWGDAVLNNAADFDAAGAAAAVAAAKQDTLVSGTNIKTVNGSTLLGSGDVTISGGLTQQQIEGII